MNRPTRPRRSVRALVHLAARRVRLIAASIAAVAAATLVASGAYAAQPDGVAFDAHVDVTFLAASLQGTTGDPVPGGAVHVVASRDGATIQELDSTTDATGVAAIDGVARGTDGSPVRLDITATWSSASTDTRGCTDGVSVFGTASLAPVGASQAVAVIGFPSSSISCPAPATPHPTNAPRPTAAPTGGIGSAVSSRPKVTPPPTDTGVDPTSSAASPAWDWIVLGLIMLAIALTSARPRSRRRRR